jgi:dTDP-4-amino-4,6-dideoxygalactose transaminase
MDTIQAAMISVNLKYLKEKINKSQEIAKRYTSSLKEVVTCPPEVNGSHVFYTYAILASRRDELKEYLSKNGIETKINHPILMPYHTAYRGKFSFSIPVAERIVQQLLCIPNENNLTAEQVDYIIDHVKRFYKGK